MARPKKIKNKKTTGIAKEIRRLGVFIEDTNGNVKLLAEQYGDIKGTLHSHTEILNSHSETLKAHTKALSQLTMDLTIVKEDVEFIKNSVKRKIDVEEFAALERRVALLEKRR